MSEKLENNVWSSIAEQETATQGINPSLILKLLLYADLTVCYQLIFPIDTHIHSCTHTHTQRKKFLLGCGVQKCLKEKSE